MKYFPELSLQGRTASVNRLLARSKLVILHDTESMVRRGNPMGFPQDFM